MRLKTGATGAAHVADAVESAKAGGLRYVTDQSPGFSRQRSGNVFRYFNAKRKELREPTHLARIKSLVIPPAWRDVWICPIPNGHLQAVGTDSAGRRQYLYHQAWRARRDQEKFDSMLAFARALPGLRERAAAHLGEDGLTRERVLACA